VVATAVAVGVAGMTSCRTPPTGGGGTGGAGRYRSRVFDTIQTTADIPYSTATGKNGLPQTLRLDIRRPAGDTNTKRPLFITAYGGAFIFGDKNIASDPAHVMAEDFARYGYVTAEINYRLLASGTCTGVNSSASCENAALAGIFDGVAAVRYLRANAATYGIDPDRIAFGGDSAGGVMASGVGMAGNLPLDQQPAAQANRSTPGTSGQIQAFMALSGGSPDTRFADADDAPGIYFHGTADTIVPYSYATTAANGLKAVGVDAKVVPYAGQGHVPWQANRADIEAQTADWFYTHLDLANAAR
jgi:acetyl esterase/lipase